VEAIEIFQAMADEVEVPDGWERRRRSAFPGWTWGVNLRVDGLAPSVSTPEASKREFLGSAEKPSRYAKYRQKFSSKLE
jgi:hypothetical protein